LVLAARLNQLVVILFLAQLLLLAAVKVVAVLQLILMGVMVDLAAVLAKAAE
jgi:hypothetical protein